MFWWQEKGKLEVFIKSNRYLVPTEDFIKYLEKETVKCLVDEEFYAIHGYIRHYNLEDNEAELCSIRSNMPCGTEKAMYYNVLHFMLCNMKETVKVQVYDDGAVRLYQYDEDMKLSIWWDTPECYTHPLNLSLLGKLIEFVKQYK